MLNNPETLETIFSIASTLAMIAWVILILLPRRWDWLNKIPLVIIPILLAIAYSVILAWGIATSDGDGSFSSLAGVKTLFASDRALLAGWIHYLAFDLLVGTMIAKAADEEGINRFIQAPILFFTFMFGPFGYLLFQITNGVRKFLGTGKTT